MIGLLGGWPCTISTLGGCGGFGRTGFQCILLWKDMVVM